MRDAAFVFGGGGGDRQRGPGCRRHGRGVWCGPDVCPPPPRLWLCRYIPYIKGFSDSSNPDTASFGDTIDLWTAPNATGPWSETPGVYHIPIPPTLKGKVWCYAAKAHPELAEPDADHFVLT